MHVFNTLNRFMPSFSSFFSFRFYARIGERKDGKQCGFAFLYSLALSCRPVVAKGILL